MSIRRKSKWPTIILIVFLIITLFLLLMSYGVIPNYFSIDLDFGGHAPLFIAMLIIIATKIWLDLVEPLFIRAFSPRTESEADAAAVFQVMSYVTWFVALAAVIWIIAGGPEGIGLLSLGLVSAAMIYVLQKPLLNIVGWAVLVYRRLYNLGDRIEVNDVRGYVTNISLMNTIVREFRGWMSGDSFTGRLVSIPNSFILEANVYNYTKDTRFIWDEVVINVTYESDPVAAQWHVLEATEEVAGNFMRKYSKYIREKYEFSDMKAMMIEEPKVLTTLGDYSIKICSVYLCRADRRREARSRIISNILKRIAEDENVQIAYPHMEIVPYRHRPFESRAVSEPVDDFSALPSEYKGKAKEKS